MRQMLTTKIAICKWAFMLLLTSFVSLPVMASSASNYDILSARDIDLYKEIFELQDAGLIKQAGQLITKVENPLLMGHVLSQKYLHPTAWRSSFKELSQWLDHYHDHPAASRISS